MAAMDSITITYWPMRGRAGSIFLMLDHAGIAYEHKSEFADIAKVASAFGGPHDTFAPPIVQDGPKIYSQSTATAMWAGRKAGLTEGVDEIKALQHLADMIDIMENGVAGAISKGSDAVKEFLEGERLAKLMGNLQKGVQGPFFFGDKPSCVDFFWANMNDWLGATFHDRLVSEFGSATFTAAYPKLDGVVSGIRALESYKASTIPITRDDHKAKDELYAAWKK